MATCIAEASGQQSSVATQHARDAGYEWLHADFEPHLQTLYFDACGSLSDRHSDHPALSPVGPLTARAA